MKKSLSPDDLLQKALATPAPAIPTATAAAPKTASAAVRSPKTSPAMAQQKRNPIARPHQAPMPISQNELNSLKEVSATVHQIKISAQHELEAARKMRDDAHRYQMATATRARSDAQQLLLRTRLATQRETEELLRKAGEEIQKVLADIRMIRIMAQEELAAQRKFTDAVKLRSMSFAIQGEAEKSEPKKKKQLASIK
ncbi:MAG TPA: hypothetical protein VMB24_05320 [Dehalococcoidales bacterium]|nr:hypothetical protein [Dehalococcoidales bacterium]